MSKSKKGKNFFSRLFNDKSHSNIPQVKKEDLEMESIRVLVSVIKEQISSFPQIDNLSISLNSIKPISQDITIRISALEQVLEAIKDLDGNEYQKFQRLESLKVRAMIEELQDLQNQVKIQIKHKVTSIKEKIFIHNDFKSLGDITNVHLLIMNKVYYSLDDGTVINGDYLKDYSDNLDSHLSELENLLELNKTLRTENNSEDIDEQNDLIQQLLIQTKAMKRHFSLYGVSEWKHSTLPIKLNSMDAVRSFIEDNPKNLRVSEWYNDDWGAAMMIVNSSWWPKDNLLDIKPLDKKERVLEQAFDFKSKIDAVKNEILINKRIKGFDDFKNTHLAVLNSYLGETNRNSERLIDFDFLKGYRTELNSYILQLENIQYQLNTFLDNIDDLELRNDIKSSMDLEEIKELLDTSEKILEHLVKNDYRKTLGGSGYHTRVNSENVYEILFKDPETIMVNNSRGHNLRDYSDEYYDHTINASDILNPKYRQNYLDTLHGDNISEHEVVLKGISDIENSTRIHQLDKPRAKREFIKNELENMESNISNSVDDKQIIAHKQMDFLTGLLKAIDEENPFLMEIKEYIENCEVNTTEAGWVESLHHVEEMAAKGGADTSLENGGAMSIEVFKHFKERLKNIKSENESTIAPVMHKNKM